MLINKQHTVVQLVVQKYMTAILLKFLPTNFLYVTMIDFIMVRQICICCYGVT